MKHLCIVLADAGRARIFSYEVLASPDGPHEELREERDLIDPARRNVSDEHFRGHVDELDTKFARTIASATAEVMTGDGYRELAVIASPHMLGKLRGALDAIRRTHTIVEFHRDLTKLGIAEIREHLTDLRILPARVIHAAGATA